MGKYLNPEEVGHEPKKHRIPAERDQVSQRYCPRDGHYCEQPDCGNCMAESSGAEVWGND